MNRINAEIILYSDSEHCQQILSGFGILNKSGFDLATLNHT